MRILILSCDTGGGHNACAEALREELAARGDEGVVEDSLRFLAPGVSRLLAGGHTAMYRHAPGLFRRGYAFLERHPGAFGERSAVCRFLTGGTERLHRYIRDGAFDAVLCVHVFAALQLTAVRRAHPSALRTGFVATDYTCSPGVRESRLDWYFIPDEALAGQFLCPNIPRERLVSSGIPVRRAFYGRTDRAAARERFGVARRSTHLLVMCGSMGCGPLRRLTKALSSPLPPGCELTVACGTNERLRRRLEQRFARNGRVHIRGYVEDMSALMDSADLYLTKPGGLSVTEAAVKGLPMVLVDAVAGCEEYNRRYFQRLGGAWTGKGIEELAQHCRILLTDHAARGRMAAAFVRPETKSAARRICETIRQAGKQEVATA